MKTIRRLLLGGIAAAVLVFAAPSASDAAHRSHYGRHCVPHYYGGHYSTYYAPRHYGYRSFRYPYYSGYHRGYYGPRVGVNVGPLTFGWWR